MHRVDQGSAAQDGFAYIVACSFSWHWQSSVPRRWRAAERASSGHSGQAGQDVWVLCDRDRGHPESSEANAAARASGLHFWDFTYSCVAALERTPHRWRCSPEASHEPRRSEKETLGPSFGPPRVRLWWRGCWAPVHVSAFGWEIFRLAHSCCSAEHWSPELFAGVSRR